MNGLTGELVEPHATTGTVASYAEGRLEHPECFRTGETLSLLHGDIAPGNALWGREPALIDWEYTRLGDPADEIAYLFDQHALAEPQRQAFWDEYGRSVNTTSALA